MYVDPTLPTCSRKTFSTNLPQSEDPLETAGGQLPPFALPFPVLTPLHIYSAIYARAGCPSVRHMLILYRNSWTDRVGGFWYRSNSQLLCVVTEFRCLQDKRTFIWNLIRTPNLAIISVFFLRRLSTVASVVSLVWPSQVYHTKHSSGNMWQPRVTLAVFYRMRHYSTKRQSLNDGGLILALSV